MTSSKDDGRSLPLHPPIDSQPFLKCAAIYRRIAIGVSVVGIIHMLALQFVGSAPSAKAIGVVVAICVGYSFLGILLVSCSSLLEGESRIRFDDQRDTRAFSFRLQVRFAPPLVSL